MRASVPFLAPTAEEMTTKELVEHLRLMHRVAVHGPTVRNYDAMADVHVDLHDCRVEDHDHA